MNAHKTQPEATKSVDSLNFKIIVIENDDGLNQLIQEKLQNDGYQTEAASTGKEALDKISGNENEILLIANQLPDMTGKQLTEHLIEKYHKTPSIIVVTGFGDEKIALEMMKLGVWDYLVKDSNFLDILPQKIKYLCKIIERNRRLKKAEEDLRKSLEVLNDTGDMARVGGWEVDLENNTVYWTQSTKKIHEVAEDYVPILEEAINFFPGESKIQIEKAIDKAINEGIGYDLELQFVTAKGNKLWVHAIGKAEMKAGKCVRLYGTFQDINERKKVEDELKMRHIILQRTEKIAHVGSWDWDIAKDAVSWSDELFNIFKLDPKKGAPSYADHAKIFTTESRIKEDEAVKKCINTGESFNLDLEIIRGDGKTAYCSSRGFAKKDENGKIIGLFGSFQDITERKRAEEEHKKSEERLKSVFDNSPFPIAVVDLKDQNILYWSKSAIQLFGHEPKTTEEWRELSYPDPEYRQKVIDRWNPFLEIAKKSPVAINTGEYQIHCKNGTVKNCELYAQFIPGYLIVTLNDITESKKAEEQLKALNQQLLANEQQLRAANQQLQANEQELQASNQQLRANEQQLLASNQQLQASEQQLRAAVQQLQANEQELIGAKEKAEESEKRMNLVIKGSNDAPWDWDLINDELFYSPQWWQQIGYSPNEIPTNSLLWERLMHPDDKIQVDKIFGGALKNGQESYAVEFRLLHKQGYYVPILSRGFITFNENKKPTRVSGSNLDLTERKRTEAELIKAKEKAEEADRLKSAFLANMSHEIRTPMNGILGFSDLLKEPGLNKEEQQRFIGIIQKSGKRMLNTVNDLIDISKIETGQMELLLKEFNISNELESQFQFFHTEAEKKGIKLTLTNSIPHSCNIINADIHKFNSILTNLIKNALKFTDEGSIHIGCIKMDGHLEFFVKDSGVGIPKNRQEAIFDRFVQADIADTRALEGSGLGLAISKAYAEMMGGKLWVKSEEGIGSTFYFSMPLQKSDSKKVDDSIEESSNQTNLLTNKPTILVAEDDEVSFQHLAIILKSTAKEIIHAKTGLEAVEVCRKNQDIDLVLMDIKMPQINGYEATQRIRAFNKEVTIIAQTAFALTGDYEKSIEAGCNDYIAKPIGKAKLAALIAKWFE